MPIKSSGPIDMKDIAAELGISATDLTLNDSRCRSLANKPSGAIYYSDFYGKSSFQDLVIVEPGATQAVGTRSTENRTLYAGVRFRVDPSDHTQLQVATVNGYTGLAGTWRTFTTGHIPKMRIDVNVIGKGYQWKRGMGAEPNGLLKLPVPGEEVECYVISDINAPGGVGSDTTVVGTLNIYRGEGPQANTLFSNLPVKFTIYRF